MRLEGRIARTVFRDQSRCGGCPCRDKARGDNRSPRRHLPSCVPQLRNDIRIRLPAVACAIGWGFARAQGPDRGPQAKLASDSRPRHLRIRVWRARRDRDPGAVLALQDRLAEGLAVR